MQDKQSYYSVSDYGDRLKPGENLKIEHAISFRKENADITELVSLPISELERCRTESVKLENIIFEQLRADVGRWEDQAAITLLLNKAIEYSKTPACEHTGNQWRADDNGNQYISNMTYKMSCHVYEHQAFDHKKGESVPVSWDLTWSVDTNRKITGISYVNNVKIAGQDRKRFTNKPAMEKYLQGRIKAFSHLFTELSPPVPQEYAKCFKVNGHLLPGYRIAEDASQQAECAGSGKVQRDKGKTSVLGKIAEAREEQREAVTGSREGTHPGKKANKSPEL